MKTKDTAQTVECMRRSLPANAAVYECLECFSGFSSVSFHILGISNLFVLNVGFNVLIYSRIQRFETAL